MDTNKARALVEYLTRHDRAVTAKELAGFLNLSVRSVKSYISSINGEAKAPFIISGHSGYTTNPAAARNYLRAGAAGKHAAGLRGTRKLDQSEISAIPCVKIEPV